MAKDEALSGENPRATPHTGEDAVRDESAALSASRLCGQ
jgi:hypothetical protein